MASKTVSVKEICKLLAGDDQVPLTEMAISQFVKAGMPKAARGQYNPIVCMHWRIGQLRRREEERKVEGEDGKEVSLDQADIRLKTVKAQLEEMTLAEREGRLVPIELYEAELSKFATTIQASLMNLPARLASKMEGLTTMERKALLSASVRGCLSTLSERSKDARAPEPVVTAKPAAAKSSRKPRKRK